MKRRKLFKRIAWTFFFLFVAMNVIAFFHAYKFTHFSNTSRPKTEARGLTFGQKIKAVFTGIDNPRPVNIGAPTQAFETLILQSNKKIACWLINKDSAKGTIILFHGYGGEKSSMLDKSDEFQQLGYRTMLVDFMGSGGSEGNQTTIGFKEAEEVKTCFDYLVAKGEKNIYLFGTSLGAAAVLKAIDSYDIQPTGIILECPFGSMYKTTCARFRLLGIPKFPMASLLLFWGGVQNGFWAFSHNPIKYASAVNCPTLLFYGEKDERVSRDETDALFSNLKGTKTLKTFPLAGHENYLKKYEYEWRLAVDTFLNIKP